MKRLTLSLFLLVALVAKADATPPAEGFTRFVESSTVTFDGSNTYRTFGQALLGTDGTVWFFGLGTAGPRIGRTDWVSIAPAHVTTYNRFCQPLANKTFTAIGPYLDGGAIHVCADYPACTNTSGTYRALGDGGLPANQGGGVTAGIMLRDSSLTQYVLVIKTANSKGGSGACAINPGNDFGPGAVGDWLILEVRGNL